MRRPATLITALVCPYVPHNYQHSEEFVVSFCDELRFTPAKVTTTTTDALFTCRFSIVVLGTSTATQRRRPKGFGIRTNERPTQTASSVKRETHRLHCTSISQQKTLWEYKVLESNLSSSILYESVGN